MFLNFRYIVVVYVLFIIMNLMIIWLIRIFSLEWEFNFSQKKLKKASKKGK